MSAREKVIGGPFVDEPPEVQDHGGSLGRADTMYPHAPKPWLDLSTGINATPYPLPPFPPRLFERLPESADLDRLATVAARAYGAHDAAEIVCAPGTQILLPLVTGLVPPGRAAVLSPTYAEHARASRLAGHQVSEVSSFGYLADADLAIVVNPNNPDGRLHSRADLLSLADRLSARGGFLIVDEAFMDVGPEDCRVDGDVAGRNLIVLRSFGKFFGLAGLRLGFAVCDRRIAQKLRSRLGPWAVSGPALFAGLTALADDGWQTTMREKLAADARRLDALLDKAGLEIAGGTSLYRYARHPRAPELLDHLGRHGILVRAFAFDPLALRLGIPARDRDFDRLERVLDFWSQQG